MLRRSLAAAVVLLFVGSAFAAETLRGIITECTDSKIVITVRKDKDDKEGTKKEIKVNKDTKFFTGGKKGAEPKESSVGDVTKMVEKAAKAEKGPKGVFATVEVEDGKATKVTTGFNRKGKKDQ